MITILQSFKEVSMSNGRPTVAFPLTFIVFVSMVKDALEDNKRHQSDKRENNQQVTVLEKSERSMSFIEPLTPTIDHDNMAKE